MTSPTITVAIIVKNEEETLGICLNSIYDWADEIVILDSMSTDNTKNIALKYTDKFYSKSEWEGFGVQRQIAQQYVTSDYVLWLDADEEMTQTLKINISNAMNQYKDQNNIIFSLNRQNEFLGYKVKHSGWKSEQILRLYKTSFTKFNSALVHEKVILPSNSEVITLTGYFIHRPYKNLDHYLEKSNSYARLSTEQKLMQGKSGSLTKAILHSISVFIKMYILKLGLLDGKIGFVLASLSSYSTFIKYIDLWLATNKE